jgi:hypothetical protein
MANYKKKCSKGCQPKTASNLSRAGKGKKKVGKKKQGYKARKDESIAMRVKKKRTKKQLAAARNESYGRFGSKAKKRGQINRHMDGEGFWDGVNDVLKRSKVISTVGKVVLPAAGAALGTAIEPGMGSAIGAAGGTSLNNWIKSHGYGKHGMGNNFGGRPPVVTRTMYATGLHRSGGAIMRSGGALRQSGGALMRSGAGQPVHIREQFAT